MRISAQFSRFLLAGGLAAAANFLSRFFFSLFLGYIPSVTLAFIVGLITGFLLMKVFVFSGAATAPARQISYYVIVNLVGLGMTILVSVAVTRLLGAVVANEGTDEAIGHLVGVVSPVFLSFIAHKKFTFRASHD